MTISSPGLALAGRLLTTVELILLFLSPTLIMDVKVILTQKGLKGRLRATAFATAARPCQHTHLDPGVRRKAVIDARAA